MITDEAVVVLRIAYVAEPDTLEGHSIDKLLIQDYFRRRFQH